jgi:hypothetical protein
MIRRDIRRFNALVTELAVPIPDVFMKEIWRKGSRPAVRHPAAGLLYKRGCYRCFYAVMCNPKPRNFQYLFAGQKRPAGPAAPQRGVILLQKQKIVDGLWGGLYIARINGSGNRNTLMDTTTRISTKEKDVLRRLAERKVQIAFDPKNEERRRAWLALDSGNDSRVMVLAEHGGIRDRRKPLSITSLECTGEWARGIENSLRAEALLFEELQDDHVVEPVINVGWRVRASNFGVEVVVHQGGDAEHMGARSWDPPIRDLDEDFDKLRPRAYSVDRDARLVERQLMEDVFAGILPVRMRGGHYWTMGLTIQAIDLIGLEGLMLSMYDNPEGLHRLMAFLCDDNLAFSRWLEDQGLYSLNNENDYIGSGSMGYTTELPKQTPRQTDAPVREQDLWALLESQETVGVGPELFEEFIFPYQLRIAERFGRIYYGCCEPVNNRWHILKRLPNLARVSVSPWADQRFMAEALGRDYVFSRKPNPTLISTDRFDEAAIRNDIRQTLDLARGCRIELIMKDVHTLNNQPERLARWVQIAREEIENH